MDHLYKINFEEGIEIVLLSDIDSICRMMHDIKKFKMQLDLILTGNKNNVILTNMENIDGVKYVTELHRSNMPPDNLEYRFIDIDRVHFDTYENKTYVVTCINDNEECSIKPYYATRYNGKKYILSI